MMKNLSSVCFTGTRSLRTDDDLMSNMAQLEMLGRDRDDRALDWLCHLRLGLGGRIVGERERLLAAVPLLDGITSMRNVNTRKRRRVPSPEAEIRSPDQ